MNIRATMTYNPNVTFYIYIPPPYHHSPDEIKASGRIVNPIISDDHYPWMAFLPRAILNEQTQDIELKGCCTGGIIGDR